MSPAGGTARENTVLTLTGPVDRASKGRLRQDVREGINEGRGIILDLSEISFMDSEGLSVLVGAFRIAREAGRPLVLCGLSANLKALLDLTRLHRVFPSYADAAEADRALGGGQA